MLIDLHAHTYPQSDDSFLAPDELVAEARAAGLDGICLTEHDAFWGREETAALARRHNFLVLPGCEINTDDGHRLTFGLERYAFGMHKFDFLAGRIAQAGGVLIAAHPYRRRFLEDPGREPGPRAEMLQRAAADPIFGRCHGLETLNGRGRAAQNQFSADLYRQLGARGGIATGGSDAHYPGQVGAAATEFFGRVDDLADLIELLRRGACRPVLLRPAAAATPKSTAAHPHPHPVNAAAPAPAD